MTGPGGDVEWLDDEDAPAPREDEVLTAGAARPPMRRRTRVVLGVLVVVLLGGGAAVATLAGGDDRRQAGPTPTVAPTTVAATPTTPTTRSVPPIRSSERTFALELPGTPPPAAIAAIRAAFPGATLTSFSAALADGSNVKIVRFYNITSGRRIVTITISPPRPGETDAVFRTSNSLEIAQALGKSRVQVRLSRPSGAPTAQDFAAIQRLVQDPRLLATR